DDNFFTLEDYKEKISAKQTDKDEKLVYLYTSDKAAQDIYIRAAEGKGYDVLHMNGVLDSHFIGLLERKMENTRWVRVDSDTVDKLIPQAAEEITEDADALNDDQENKLKEVFEAVKREPGHVIGMAKLGETQFPVTITRPEFMRRMKEMAANGGGMAYMGEMPDTLNVVVNTDHALVRRILRARKKEELARQLVDLALLSQNMLQGKDLTDFIQRSVDMLQK
ncbi:MAG: molecular chaperone HtpG, partial [Bacteroidota bacterium]